MKNAEANRIPITRLAFALIPLSGFALDVFIPSLPAMASDLHVTPAATQFTLSIFLISLGVCQLFIGTFLDSFGRYLPNIMALALFSVASFLIASTSSIGLIYFLRALQGFSVAIIIVSKRAVLIDLYTGEALKRYMSMLSVAWSAAPIIAPFIGAFLQVHFGWRSNFFLLGFVGLMFLIAELIYDTESIKVKSPFNLKSISSAYVTMIKARDFSLSLIILGLCYTMLMVYGMVSPFIIEKILNYSPSVTGNASLLSGLFFLLGGLLSRRLISKPFFRKVLTGILLMDVVAIAIIAITLNNSSLYTLLAYVVTLHFGIGFVFNSIFSYALTKFTHFGGKASGLAGGVYIILTSAMSQSLVSSFQINNQTSLGVVYAGIIFIILIIFIATKWVKEKKIEIAEDAAHMPVSGSGAMQESPLLKNY